MDKDIEKVLLYQDKELKDLQEESKNNLEETIKSSEELLESLNVDLPDKSNAVTINRNKKVLFVPKWEDLVSEANLIIDDNQKIDSLFTKEELLSNSLIVKQVNDDFKQIYKLDKSDYAICALAGIVSGIIDVLLVGIPHNDPKMAKEGSLSNLVYKAYDKIYPQDRIDRLEKLAKVPFDAVHNQDLQIPIEGLNAHMHRLYEIGHDPIVGLIVGTLDIMKGTNTAIDKFGKLIKQDAGLDERIEKNLINAFIKEWNHLRSDVNTPMGLPAPLSGLFNLIQIGEIGSEKQTIAEIVQGMYYEGYDFRHFVSMSIPSAINELIVRFAYALKKINNGFSIKESLPISIDRNRNPKLATMLFMSHSLSSLINAGKVYITKDPSAINEAEWLAFGKYAFKQAKWILIDKPEKQNMYVGEWMYNNMLEITKENDIFFDEFSRDYIVVFDE